MNCLYEIRALVDTNGHFEWYTDTYPNYERAKEKFRYLKERSADFIELRVGFGRLAGPLAGPFTIARYSALEERS